MAFLDKEYKFEGQENFDEFLRAAGFPEEYVEKLLEFKPSYTLSKDGDTYTFTVTTEEGTKETSFESGVEMEDTIQGTAVSSTYTVEDNVVTQVIASDSGEATFTREYNDNEMVVTLTSPKFDGVAKRWYKAED